VYNEPVRKKALPKGDNMKKTFLGAFDRVGSKYTGKPSSVCVDGVTYLQFTSGATVKVDLNGKPIPCSE
jgi:hypothetical protein